MARNSSGGGRGRGGGREFMERGSAGGGRGRGGAHEIAPRFSEGGGRGRGINHGSTDNEIMERRLAGGGRGRGLSHSSAANETMTRCSEGDDRGRRINNSNTDNEIMERRLTGGRGRGGGHGSTNNELMARRSEGRGRGRVEIMQRSLEGGGRGQGCDHGRTNNGEDDDDDEPAVVGRRGPSIPTRPPTTENRIWIWIEDDEFNIHNKVSRTIGSILKSLWSGPWQGWNDVPFHHRERMFERFQKYYVWEDEFKSSIYSCWETCIKGKFGDLLMRARDKAKTLAIQEGVEVCDDLSFILPYKPYWISQEYWTTLVEAWNTQSWKDKSAQNSDNRSKAKGGRHTLGSNSFVTVRHKLDKTLKRRANFGEYWLQTHAKKGRRPLDRLVGGSVGDGSGEVDDEEETVDKQNVMWVDTKARESFETYKDCVMEKNEEDDNSNPEFDLDLWIHTIGGKKRVGCMGVAISLTHVL